MLYVRASNLPERLLAALARDIENPDGQGPAFDRLFSPPTIVVPNHEASRMALRTLADTHGVAANLPLLFLDQWLDRVVQQSVPGTRLLNRRVLHGFLLRFLADDEALADAVLAPVRAYLHAAGPGDAGDPAHASAGHDRRRFALAQRLAHLFDDYLGHRPDLCEALAGPDRALATRGSEALWQGRIWKAVLGDDPPGLVARFAAEQGTRHIPLRRFLTETPPQNLVLPSRILIYAPVPLSPAHAEALAHVARATDVFVYHWNPCAEFPQTATRTTLAAHRQSGLSLQLHDPNDPLALNQPEDPPALIRWGGPARESLHTLLAVNPDGTTFTPDFAVRAVANPLRAFQADIAERAQQHAAADPPTTHGPGITLYACPGVRREIESLAVRLWRAIEQSRDDEHPLRFNDIAVFLPHAAADSYHPHIASVFAEAQIPFRITGTALARENHVVDALDRLIALPQSAFARHDVLGLLLHPAVLAGVRGVHPSQVVALIEGLGVIHGLDREDHQSTYIDRDLWNWEHGLRRLALGAFLTGPNDGDDRPIVTDTAQYLPADLPPADLGWTLEVGRLLRRLIDTSRELRNGRRPIDQWLTAWRGLATDLIVPTADEDRRALAACFAELASLQDIPLPPTLSLALATEMARSALQTLTTTRVSDPSDGVTVTTLVAGRARPFRATFFAGMGAGHFPSPENKDELDLRRDRRLGEPTARTLDRHYFLEALLGTRDQVSLSYVARDATSGEPLEPSSVISEMHHFFAAPYLDPKAASPWEQTIPLHRHDDQETARIFDSSARDQAARALGERFRAEMDGLSGASGATTMTNLRKHLDSDTQAVLAPLLGATVLDPPPASPDNDATATGLATATTRLTLHAVRAFLECPLQGSVRLRLSLRADDGDDAQTVAMEDEPLATGGAKAATLLRRAFTVALVAARDRGLVVPDETQLTAAYQQEAEMACLAGQLPIGLFGEADRIRHRRVLEAWAEDLRSLEPQLVGPVRWLAWGGTHRQDRFAQTLDAIALPASTARPAGSNPLDGPLAVHHRSEPIFETRDGATVSLQLDPVPRRKSGAGLRETNLWLGLRGFMDALALAAAGGGAERPHQIVVAQPRPSGTLFHHTVPALSADKARHHLRTLIDDLASDRHDYFLPCEIAFTHWSQPDRPIPELVATRLQTPFRPTRSRYGPVPDGESYPTPPDPVARAMIARRFGVYLGATPAQKSISA